MHLRLAIWDVKARLSSRDQHYQMLRFHLAIDIVRSTMKVIKTCKISYHISEVYYRTSIIEIQLQKEGPCLVLMLFLQQHKTRQTSSIRQPWPENTLDLKYDFFMEVCFQNNEMWAYSIPPNQVGRKCKIKQRQHQFNDRPSLKALKWDTLEMFEKSVSILLEKSIFVRKFRTKLEQRWFLCLFDWQKR